MHFATLRLEFGAPRAKPQSINQPLTTQDTNLKSFWRIVRIKGELKLKKNENFHNSSICLARIGFHKNSGILTLFKDRAPGILLWPKNKSQSVRLDGSCVMAAMPESKQPDIFEFSIVGIEHMNVTVTLKYEDGFACQSIQNILFNVPRLDDYIQAHDYEYHEPLLGCGFAGQNSPNSIIGNKFLLYVVHGVPEFDKVSIFDWLINCPFAVKRDNSKLYLASSFVLRYDIEKDMPIFITRYQLRFLLKTWEHVVS